MVPTLDLSAVTFLFLSQAACYSIFPKISGKKSSLKLATVLLIKMTVQVIKFITRLWTWSVVTKFFSQVLKLLWVFEVSLKIIWVLLSLPKAWLASLTLSSVRIYGPEVEFHDPLSKGFCTASLWIPNFITFECSLLFTAQKRHQIHHYIFGASKIKCFQSFELLTEWTPEAKKSINQKTKVNSSTT